MRGRAPALVNQSAHGATNSQVADNDQIYLPV